MLLRPVPLPGLGPALVLRVGSDGGGKLMSELRSSLETAPRRNWVFTPQASARNDGIGVCVLVQSALPVRGSADPTWLPQRRACLQVLLLAPIWGNRRVEFRASGGRTNCSSRRLTSAPPGLAS